jgi:hypothetical protein
LKKELLKLQLSSLKKSKYADRKHALFFVHDFDFNNNGLRITEEMATEHIDSLNNSPLVAYYNVFSDDLAGHAEERDPITKQVKSLNTDAVGTLFNAHIGTHKLNKEDKYGVWVEGYLWTRFKHTMEVVERLYDENDVVNVSVEVLVADYDWEDDDFRHTAKTKINYHGLCLLGSTYSPAYDDAGLYSLNELEIANAFKKDLSVSEDDSIEILNNVYINGTWEDIDEDFLKNKILNLSNSEDLIKETYLICDEDNCLKYPHHIIKDGKLVIHKEAVEIAYSQIIEDKIVDKKAINHIKKHAKQLGLDFSEELNIFNGGVSMLSHDEIREQLRFLLNPDDNEEGKWTINYYSWDLVVFDDFVIAREYDTGKLFKINYSIENETEVVIEEGRKEVMIQYVEVPEKESVEVSGLFVEYKNKYSENKELSEKLASMETEYASLKEKYKDISIEDVQSKDITIAELQETIENLKKDLSTKDEALTLNENEANEKIIKLGDALEEMKAQINSLIPVKEEYEKILEEKQQAELSVQRVQLKNKIVNSKIITEEELGLNTDLLQAIEEVNEVVINKFIADKIIENALKDSEEPTDDNITVNANKGGDLISKSLEDRMLQPIK